MAIWVRESLIREGERFMDDQRVPDLEEMDEQQARQFLTEMFSVLSAEKEYAVRHEDYAMEMPQSGERIRGPENMRAFQQGADLGRSLQ